MSDLVIEPGEQAQWHRLVLEASAAADTSLDDELTAYLELLLMRYARSPELVARVMALEYLHGQDSVGGERRRRLRDVGDGCLLFSGLYPDHARRRLVSVRYFIDLGRTAYHDLAVTLTRGYADLYRDLSQGFTSLMAVMHAMRNLDSQEPALQPLTAHEVWEASGSRFARRQIHPCDRSVLVRAHRGKGC